jgi:septal ring-binding cell division protein DamX
MLTVEATALEGQPHVFAVLLGDFATQKSAADALARLEQ